MKKHFLRSLLFLTLSPSINAGLTIDLSPEAQKRSICIGYLCETAEKQIKPFPTWGYGVLSGNNIFMPPKTRYIFFTTFPLHNESQLSCLIEEGKVKHKGVLSQGKRTALLKQMLTHTTAHALYKEDAICQELVTVYQVPERNFSKLFVSIQDDSGKPYLCVSETEK
jgi:hypothetical protein